MNDALTLAAGFSAIFLALLVFRRPLGAAVRLVGRSALGLGGIWLFNQVGAIIGVQVGVNLLTGLTVGALGLPGFGLLLLLPCLQV